MDSKPDFIIVIGASAGGLKATSEVLRQFNADMPASVFVVQHLHKKIAGDYILTGLSETTGLQCIRASDNEPIVKGCVYIAASNEHLIVKRDKIVMGHGPAENRWKPSIDVLFRSAAVAYNTRVIGIVLTGLLSDGTAGMIAINRSGGKTIVQDPREAEYPDMPTSVLDQLDVDFCVPVNQMGAIVTNIMNVLPEQKQPPDDIIMEANIVERSRTRSDATIDLAEPSLFACPDCGGPLRHISENNLSRYRCHIGHAFSETELEIRQGESVEFSLWVAVRIMEERKSLLLKMSNDAQKKGYAFTSEEYLKRAIDLESHINRLKDVLIANEKNDAQLRLRPV